MLNNSMRIKGTLNTALTFSAGILCIILVLSLFIGIPYIFTNLENINKIITPIIIFSIGVSYFIITIMLLGIVSSSKVNVFVVKNSKRFKKVGYLLFANLILEYIALLFAKTTYIKLIDIFPGVFITPTIAIYFIAGLLCFVIGDTIYEATKQKN